MLDGTGGITSAGASKPFLVGAADREPDMKRCLALGAEATRRMKRVADAPIARGDKGPERLAEGPCPEGRVKDCWDGSAVWDLGAGRSGARERLMRCFSDFVLTRG